jgi:hypothetical protein
MPADKPSKRTTTSLYRASERTQSKAVHFGLALKGEQFTKRLIDTGGTLKKNRITHPVHFFGLALSRNTSVGGEVPVA